MTPLGRFAFWLTSVIVAGSVGLKLGSPVSSAPKLDPKQVVATANNQPITREDVDKLFPLYQSDALGEVILDQLLVRAAEQKKIKLDTSEWRGKSTLRTAAGIWGDYYVRQLILSQWPDERLRRFHSLFHDELTQYQLSWVQIMRAGDKHAVQEDLDREVDLTSLATRYSVDDQGKKHEFLRWYSKKELEEEFGVNMSIQLLRLQPGQCTDPVNLNSQVFVIGLNKIRTRYEDLKPVLEQRAIEAGRSALINDLVTKSHINFFGALASDPQRMEYGR